MHRETGLCRERGEERGGEEGRRGGSVSHTKKNTYDELTELLPACGRKVRELKKFAQAAPSDDQTTGFLRQLANDDLKKTLMTHPIARLGTIGDVAHAGRQPRTPQCSNEGARHSRAVK